MYKDIQFIELKKNNNTGRITKNILFIKLDLK